MSRIIAVDFDGTCVRHAFPDLGEDVPGAADTLLELVECGHRLILWTMRTDVETATSDDPEIHAEPAPYLTQAVGWFKRNDIPLWSVLENPEQRTWTTSPKVYAHYYIDDAAIGCPLIHPGGGQRPYVDWYNVRRHLIQAGLIWTRRS